MAATRADRAETASAYMSFHSGVHRRERVASGEAARAQGYGRTMVIPGTKEYGTDLTHYDE